MMGVHCLGEVGTLGPLERWMKVGLSCGGGGGGYYYSPAMWGDKDVKGEEEGGNGAGSKKKG